MSEPVRHRVTFEDAVRHRVAIESRYPAGAPREVFMPVWTPGSYLVREYARHIETMAAEDAGGAPLAIAKSAKNRWRVETEGDCPFTLRYRLYAHELTVRTNFVDSDFALLHGAATFCCGVGDEARPHEVRVVPGPGWKFVHCALPAEEDTLRARDFDALVDAPIYSGGAPAASFQVAGREHRIVHQGGEGLWDHARSLADCRALVSALYRLWGFLPYERYLLVDLLAPGKGGGLEHADCAVLLADPIKARTRKGYLDWLTLTAHEIFHAWNVKRLRPRELGPFDYERENHTKSLWVAEGITDYYDDLLVHRAGLSTRKEYFAALSKHLQTVEETPGRAVQPLADASYDAWIKYYRQDENTSNSAVSYYTKGSLVALLLDVRLRRESGGRASLDTVMRLAYDRWSGARGFSEEEFRATAQEVANADLADFFGRFVDGVEELPVDEALDWLGLRRRAKPRRDGEQEPAWPGCKTRVEEGRLIVSQVTRDGPAWNAGLSPGDEIVALGGYRVAADQWDERLRSHQPREEVEMLVARRERMLTLGLTLGSPPETLRIEPDPAADEERKARLDAWLGG